MAKKTSTGTKSGIITLRLDPALRYQAELYAQRKRRSLASVVEEALEQFLQKDPIVESDGHSLSATQVASFTWDIDEPDRLANLAEQYPELLTYDQQRIWKTVRETPYFWKGKKLQRKQLREHWEVVKKVAAGEMAEQKLPSI